jgi:hypothetical protein
MNDPERDGRLRVLEQLNCGAPTDDVQGETEQLWRTLFTAYRIDHFDCKRAPMRI